LIAKFGLSIRLLEAALLVICFVVKFTRIPAWILWLLLYLAVSGFVGIAKGTDSFSLFITEFRGVSFSLLYYCFFFKMIRNDFERAFLTYARIAFWFAVIGFLFWAGTCVATHGLARLQGLATEPAQFCNLVLPAYYWYAHKFITARKNGLEVAVFTTTVLLSVSSLGFLSVTFGIVLLLSRRSKLLLVAPLIVSVLLGLAYSTSSYFRQRVDETVVAATTSDLTGSGLSTFALVSNAMITQQVLKENPVMGNGFGSHPMSHERFLASLPGIESFVGWNLESTNAKEAASFTLRVVSEFGILGFFAMLYFLVHFHVSGNEPSAAISNAVLVVFFLKLIRSGEYYQPEQFFFIFIYVLNYQRFRREVRAGVHGIPNVSAKRLNLATNSPNTSRA